MKNFKFSSFLASLSGIVMISIFVTSCNKDEISSDENKDQIDKELFTVTPELETKMVYLKPPKGFENRTEEEKQSYFDQLSEKEHNKLQENYRISDYLRSKGLLEEIEAGLKEGEFLSIEKLSKTLSVKQLKGIEEYEPMNNNTLKAACVFYPTRYCVIGSACPTDFQFDRALYLRVCTIGVITTTYGYFCPIYCT